MKEFDYKQRALRGRQKERFDLAWDIAFGTDEQREDAKARLEFMDAEDRAWNRARKENPHLWGEE